MAQYSGPRILVHLRSSHGQTRLAKFSEFILDYVHKLEKKTEKSADPKNEGIVKCFLEVGKLILEQCSPSSGGHLLKHPAICPPKR